MADLARLGFTIDSTQVDRGVTALRRLTPAAREAEVAAGGVSAAANSMGGALRSAAGGLPGLTANLGRVANSGTATQAALSTASTGFLTLSRNGLMASSAMGSVTASLAGAAAGIRQTATTTVGATAQVDAHVQAWRRYQMILQQIPGAAAGARTSIQRLGASANDNINRMQATPGNIAAQFQDIGVTAAGGMSPLLIALQQGTQLSAAMTGGVRNLWLGLKQVFSPITLVTIALVALVAIGIQWAMAAFNGAKQTEKLAQSFDKGAQSADFFGQAQSQVGKVFDTTTGKLITHNGVLSQYVKLQAQANIVAAQAARIDATKAVTKAGQSTFMESVIDVLPAGGGSAPGTNQAGAAQAWKNLEATRAKLAPLNDVLGQFTNTVNGSSLSVDGLNKATDKAIGDLDRLAKAGKLANRDLIATKKSVLDLAVARGQEFANTDVVTSVNQGRLTNSLVTPKKATEKHGKTDAEKLIDVYDSARADIATEKARALANAVGVNIERAAALEQETKLLNSIQQKGIPITDAVRKTVAELSAEYGRAKLAAETAEAFGKSILATDSERQDLINQRELIGKYGTELLRLKYIQDLITKPQQRGIVFDEKQIAELNKRANSLAQGSTMNLNKQYNEDRNRQFTEQVRLLKVQEGALGLAGQALIEYNYAQDMVTAALGRGIDAGDIDYQTINRQAEAYAALKYQLDRTAEAIAFTHETSKAFFTDWVQNVREGQNVFSAFADAVVNALNKIINKALDSALDGLFNASGVAGLFGGLSKSGIAAANSTVGATVAGNASVFAKGGTFTNGIVNSPTLFKFAKGTGMMGEAGPEAIMPLKRGADGSLGVRVSDGGGRAANNNSLTNAPTYNIGGVMTPEAIIAAIRQGDQQSQADIARALPALLSEYQRNGTTG